MAEEDGFLSRWSRRKQQAQQGGQASPTSPTSQALGGRSPAEPPAWPAQAQAPRQPSAQEQGEPTAAPEAKLPTVEDTLSLTPESDFKPFMARGVAPEVKNAAMKKLFADPHFNTMDRLDIYIDDYSRPDPLPPAMLRQLASARFLKLFDEEEERPEDRQPGDDAHSPGAPDVAQSPLCNDFPSQPAAPEAAASRLPDADPDLRLQQDHAAGPPGPGRGTA